jgi:protocatechuate 3,4-dioxygenase beta subunit
VLKLFLSLSLVLMIAPPVLGQTVVLQGVVTDQSGAVVPGATITLTMPSRSARATRSKNDGRYSFSGLAPGDYVVQSSAPSLALPEPVKVSLKSSVEILNL